MNELQVFSNPEFGQLRTVKINGEPWAVGKDVAEALGYKDTVNALKKHVDEEDKMGCQNTTPSITDSMGREQYPIWINESGLYSLILSSKLPAAKRFKRWVTSEVLPTLRKMGSYTVQNVEPEQRPLTLDDYMNAARILAGCRNERLPYVLPLIKKAGIDIEMDVRPVIKPGNAKDPATARLLNTALNDYDVSIRALERLTGIHTAQLYRMRNGTARYNEARAAIIRDVVHALVPELDIDAVTQGA